MTLSHLLLLAALLLSTYAMSGCWMLQVVCYPTYLLVGPEQFVAFHVASGKRLVPAFLIQALLASLTTYLLIFIHPSAVPSWAPLSGAACVTGVLLLTVLVEVPKHNALDRDGKSEVLIQGLVRNNLPRALLWTGNTALLLYMATLAFQPR